MAKIPAVCGNCGLIFPSWLQIMPSGFALGNGDQCPRCQNSAPILDGYATIINGMVAFIVSPQYSLDEKQFLIDTARAVGKGEIKTAEATRQLDRKNAESGRLFREWLTVGSVFVSAMAAVGMFLLAYIESGKNEPPEEPAMEKVDDFLRNTPQLDRRLSSGPIILPRPTARPLNIQPHMEESKANAASPNPPNENRHARRARIKKSRTKSRK